MLQAPGGFEDNIPLRWCLGAPLLLALMKMVKGGNTEGRLEIFVKLG